jgi:FKBP-type peptidyl-prolyl cis-trans isomerase
MRVQSASLLSAAAAILFSAPTAVASDGLLVETTNHKTCKRPSQSGDTISVHYRGTLQSDGSQFDESYSRRLPFTFKLGAAQVIKGWEQGLLNMCVGEQRKLTIPPELAYGHRTLGAIPPDSTLSTFCC